MVLRPIDYRLGKEGVSVMEIIMLIAFALVLNAVANVWLEGQR